MNPRAVAIQGIGYTPRLIALQGFGFVDIVPPEPEGGARRPKRHSLKAEFYGADRTLDLLRQDDETVTDLIIALLTKGFFDGTH